MDTISKIKQKGCDLVLEKPLNSQKFESILLFK